MNIELISKLTSIAECIYSKYENKQYIPQNWGIYDGNCGIILFLFYYARHTKNKKYEKLAEILTTKLLDIFCYEINKHSFSGGLSGILYLLDFMKEQKFIDVDLSDCKKEIEDFLFKQMKKEIKRKHYDFMHGALGIGIYFLKVKTSTTFIFPLIDFLYETAEKDFSKKIFKWQSIINDERQERGYNISLSHGISSIVIFLSKVIQADIKNDRILIMLEGAVNYILSQEIHENKTLSLFPSQSLENNEYSRQSKYSRLAWCYGDLGVGLALFQAGKSIQNKEWYEKGLQILKRSTSRKDLYQNHVIDTGICHGSTGVAMIFNRLYLETNDFLFFDTSQYWLNVTLTMDHFKDGLIGYKTYCRNKWQKDYSLLTGISGIGIFLLSALYKDRQEWDNIFLLT